MSDRLQPPKSYGGSKRPPLVGQFHDFLIGGGLFAGGIIILLVGVQPFAEFPTPIAAGNALWHALPLGIACSAVCVQSRYPTVAFGIAVFAVVVDAAIGLHLVVLIAWTNTIYVVGRFGSPEERSRVKWIVMTFCLAMGTWTWIDSGNLNSALMGISQVAVFAAVALWWSGEVRTGHERAKFEELRADAVRRQAEAAQVELVRQERASLAARLHDTISSKLSTIAIFTTGTLDIAPDEQRDRRVLGEIRGSTLSALDDMRKLIEILRSYDLEVSDEVVESDMTLASAVAMSKSVGLQIDIEAEPLTVDPALNRLLAVFGSEALSNAIKHGDGLAKLQLEGSSDLVRISVENGIRSSDGPSELPDGVSGGAGLGVMALRVKQAGGRFSAGEHLRSGTWIWRTFAEFPRTNSKEQAVEHVL